MVVGEKEKGTSIPDLVFRLGHIVLEYIFGKTHLRKTPKFFSKSHTAQERLRNAGWWSEYQCKIGKINKVPTAAQIVWSGGNRRSVLS